MALKNRFSEEGFELFNYFSSKGTNYDGEEKTRKVWNSYKNTNKKGYSIATIYYYAKTDNKDKFIKIMKKYSMFYEFDLSSTAIAKYIKHMKSDSFVWKDKILYSYNGKYWEINDSIMNIYIGEELHDFLKELLATCFWNDKEFTFFKRELKKLKCLKFKKEIIETTKDYLTNNEIEFDNKYWLFGFNNNVYDLKLGKFREYQYDDYISITTGYIWIDPITEELDEMKTIIKQILPDKEIRNLYMTILSTGIE